MDKDKSPTKEEDKASTKKDGKRPRLKSPPETHKDKQEEDEHPMKPPSETGIDKKESNTQHGKGPTKNFTKEGPEESQAPWQLPVGLTAGAVALALIAFVVIIYLRRTNTVSNQEAGSFMIHTVDEPTVSAAAQPGPTVDFQNPLFDGSEA